MRVFVAGASGAIGRRLVPLLTACGHDVIAATRSKDKFQTLLALGAEPALMDGLDRDQVVDAVLKSRPDTIVHEMTSIAPMRSLKNLDEQFVATNRLRIEGTGNLLAAARQAGTRRFVAQSYAGWPNIREGGRIKTEEDPLDPSPPHGMAQTLNAIRTLESMVTRVIGVVGIVLRYGSFYGPGTSLSRDGEMVQLVRQRKIPVAGDGAGIWSFIHVDDAANATRLAIERGAPGIYNIVDDDPAEVSVWLPELARVLGAKPPRHLPAWLARLVLGETGLSIMTRARGSSNAKAKSELHWRPNYASWRQGFREGLSAELSPNESPVSGKGEKQSWTQSSRTW